MLRFAKPYRPVVLTKSGLMLGLGETPAKSSNSCAIFAEPTSTSPRSANICSPPRRNLPVAEYVTPAQFDDYREFGLSLGFKMVFSGPLVRSSYMADVVNQQASES